MPTNEERREVAAKLRVLADENTVTATPNFNHVLFGALGGEPPVPPSNPTLGDLEAYDKALLYRLADLIEPEQERTCRMEVNWDYDGDCPAYYRDYVCSECKDNFIYYKYSRVSYCPNCGAKVVGNVE